MIVALEEISKGTHEGGSQKDSSTTRMSGPLSNAEHGGRNLQILRDGGIVASKHQMTRTGIQYILCMILQAFCHLHFIMGHLQLKYNWPEWFL